MLFSDHLPSTNIHLDQGCQKFWASVGGNSPDAWCCCDARKPHPSAAWPCNLWPGLGSGGSQRSVSPPRGQTPWSQRPAQSRCRGGKRPWASPPATKEDDSSDGQIAAGTFRSQTPTCSLSSISCRALISLNAWLGMPSSSLLRDTFFSATVSPVWRKAACMQSCQEICQWKFIVFIAQGNLYKLGQVLWFHD